MEEKERKLEFPEGFLWGAAVSAYQVEGGNTNDWSEWEKKNADRLAEEAKTKWQDWQKKKFPEMFDPKNYICGRACDFYNRYESDLDIAKSLGLNAFRISIEWSRIEPEEGKFDEKEIEHYRKVIKAIRERGMEPFVTLWHYTNPLWIQDIGGWENKKTIRYFTRYVEKAAESLGRNVDYWITLNEPQTYSGLSFASGIRPPCARSLYRANKVYRNLMKAHRKAYFLIHKKNGKNSKVGICHLMSYHTSASSSLLNKLFVKIFSFVRNHRFLQGIKRYQDFIGLNYYFHDRVKMKLGGKFFIADSENVNHRISDLGWEIYPEGIYHILRELRKYSVPIYITENGVADAEDEKREKFIRNHLIHVHRAISEGVDTRGYFFWSLMDNLEWEIGFWPRFGLVEVDYKTMERRIRPSAWEYAKICQENKLVL